MPRTLPPVLFEFFLWWTEGQFNVAMRRRRISIFPSKIAFEFEHPVITTSRFVLFFALFSEDSSGGATHLCGLRNIYVLPQQGIFWF